MKRPNSILRRRLRRRDEQNWIVWYSSMYPKAYSHAFTLTAENPDLASDIVQEALALYVEREIHRQFPDENTSIEILRGLIDEVWAETSQWASEMQEISTTEMEEHRAAPLFSDEDRADLTMHVRTLRPDLRQIAEMRRAGASLSEIARKTNLTYGAVAARLHRLKKKWEKTR